MFGIGFWEIMLIVLIAVVVINPKDYPKLIYNAGAVYSKLQLLFANLKEQYSKFTNITEETNTSNDNHYTNSKDTSPKKETANKVLNKNKDTAIL